MDEVHVGAGQGPGSKAAGDMEPVVETREQLEAQLADDDTLREKAEPLVLRVFGKDVRVRVVVSIDRFLSSLSVTRTCTNPVVSRFLVRVALRCGTGHAPAVVQELETP